jgi:microcystin-dependent protein
MTRPIPQVAPAVRPPLAGWWTATVVTVTPADGLVVNIPALTGGDGRHGGCLTAAFTPPLRAGDPVWVCGVNGSRDVFVVCARRGPADDAPTGGAAIITAAGAPTPDVGNTGDFYIDTASGIRYGPKDEPPADPAWPDLPMPPRADVGPGEPDETVEMWIDTSSDPVVFRYRDDSTVPWAVLGTAGSAGPPGPAGPAGPTGPTGSIVLFSTPNAPTGWLACDGSAVSRTTYAALFAVVGIAWGSGDGSTTFNLPDLRGSVPVGYKVSDPDFGTFAAKTGAKTVAGAAHAHTGAAHSHGASSMYAEVTVATGGGPALLSRKNTPSWNATVSWVPPAVAASSAASTVGTVIGGTTDPTTPGAGGSTTPAATSVLQPSVTVAYIIKT